LIQLRILKVLFIIFQYSLKNDINIQKIKTSITKIFNKHEILKTKYYTKEINGNTSIYGYIDDNCKLNFE